MAERPTTSGGRDILRVPAQADRRLVEAVERVFEESAEPLRGAFLARGLNALIRLAPGLDVGELGQAVAAPSDYAVLMRALEQPTAMALIREDDPLAEARLRGLAMREQIIRAEGGTLTADEVAKHLGLTRQAVDKRRRAGKLLALSTGRRGYLYPAWQFGPDGVLPGIESVLADLTVRDPWMQAAFFLGGDPRLAGRKPLDLLRQGEVDEVRRAARGYGEHAAA